MSLLLSSAALSLLAVIAVWLTGRQDPARSPLLTLGTLLTLLALPFLAFLPKFMVEVPVLVGSADPGSVTTTISWFAIAWVCGFLAFSLRLLADFTALNRWRGKSLDSNDPETDQILENCRQQLGLRHQVGVSLHPDAVSPSIAGLLRPVVYLPTNSVLWNEETLRMVLLHELGHVARRDLWTNLAAQVACLVYWFNPAVWWLRNRLMAQCEFACDAKVIEVGADPAHYATALCDVAEAGALPQAALAMAGRASLRDRVERVVCCKRSKGSLLVGAALILTITASLALSVVRLSPTPLALNEGPAEIGNAYPPEEIRLRLTANPFPAD
ncbi:MAG: M56 family metallopeptidase [Roseibacillus sp.]|nr:M56 family metallopeptidase [Roseibacillus sp.]